jgi:hypothetical protein
MAVQQLAIKVIQRFTGTTTPVVSPLLPQIILGPGYNVQTKVAHSTSYTGTALTVPYPNKGSGEYVDQGTSETWEDNENIFPVSVFLTDAEKVTASSPTGHFGSAVKKTGQIQTGTNQIDSCSPVFSPGDVGKSIYIHDGTHPGERTISSVSAGGATIVVSGAAFTVTESVQISLLPSTGRVQRFYDAGKFSNARVGDTLEAGAGYSEEFSITAVDSSANWVELATSRLPTSEPTGWRIVATNDEIELTRDTDFTIDRDNVYISDGISDSTSPSGPVIDATVKVSYRAIKTTLADSTDYIELEEEIATKIGITTETNPLALALSKARENTTARIYFSGFDVSADIVSGATEFDRLSKLTMSDVLDRIADEDYHVLVPLTQNSSMNTELDTHVTQVSDPNGDYNRERIGIINTALIDETVIALSNTETSWDVRGVTEVVATPSDGRLYTKTGRFSSRGIGEYPDFDDTVSPKPVNPLTDLARLSLGSEADNDGYWQLEQSEQLLVRNPAQSPNNAPNWGYVATDSNKIRSCTFGLTASDQAGYVRLTGPTECFKFIPSGATAPFSSVAYLPNAQQGIPCNVTAFDAVNYAYVDTNIPWEAAKNYDTADMSQIAIHPYDDVFVTPGLTAAKDDRTWVSGAPGGLDVTTATGAVNDLDATGQFTADDVGLWLWLGGAVSDFFQIATYVDADNVTITSPPAADPTNLDGSLSRLKFTGVTAEFAGITAPVASCTLRYAGKGSLLDGTTKNASKNIESFTAGTWGVGDIGRKIRVTYIDASPNGWSEEFTIVDVVSSTEIETDKAANFTAADAVKVSIADQAYIDETVKIVSSTADQIVLSVGWAQKYVGNDTSSIEVPGVGTFGFGDSKRDVRILGGAYGGTSLTVQAVRPEELAFSGTPFSGGDDLTGFAINFISTPGNNAFRLKLKNSSYPLDEVSKQYSVERDFRYFDLNNETFIGTVQSGDIIRVSSPATIAGDYEIDSVISDTRVTLKQGSGFSLSALASTFSGSTLDNLIYELVRPKTKDQQAETIRDYASAFANRRIALVWPDQFQLDVSGVTKEVPGYHLSAVIGALCSSLPPQQPLSRLGLTGIGRLIHSKVDNHFKRSQLNTMASGGVFIIHMENDADTPHVRHQLTTDVSDIKKQEISVTRIADYISRIIKQEIDPYLGKYNINTPLLSQLKNVAQSIVDFVDKQNDVDAGPLANELRFESLQQSETNIDEVEAQVYLDAPIPFNRMSVTVII